MAKVWARRQGAGRPRLRARSSACIYRVCGIDPDSEQRWTTYTFSLLAFSAVSVLFVYGFQRLQSHLPFNPDHLAAVRPDLAWNTAVSFVTNTNWQSYGGESHDEPPHADGRPRGAELRVRRRRPRGDGRADPRARRAARASTIGNFWVDLIRTTLRILLPIAFVAAIVLVSQGVIQNFHASTHATTVAGGDADHPGRPGREPDRDQAARHQRRRVLQHELGAPVREPERLHEPDRDVLPRHDPVRGDVRARHAGEGQEVRLDDLRRDVPADDRSRSALPSASSRTATRS